MFQRVHYLLLISVVFATGCAATQKKFCSLVDEDSYVLVSIARCETIHVSFDYDPEARFLELDAYAWMPEQVATPGDSEIQGDSAGRPSDLSVSPFMITTT